MSDRQYALIVVILYSALILFSLGDPAMMLTIGRFFLGVHLDLFLSLVPYGIVSLLLVYLTFVAKETQKRKFLFLIAVSVILFFYCSLSERLEGKSTPDRVFPSGGPYPLVGNAMGPRAVSGVSRDVDSRPDYGRTE